MFRRGAYHSPILATALARPAASTRPRSLHSHMEATRNRFLLSRTCSSPLPGSRSTLWRRKSILINCRRDGPHLVAFLTERTYGHWWPRIAHPLSHCTTPNPANCGKLAGCPDWVSRCLSVIHHPASAAKSADGVQRSWAAPTPTPSPYQTSISLQRNRPFPKPSPRYVDQHSLWRIDSARSKQMPSLSGMLPITIISLSSQTRDAGAGTFHLRQRPEAPTSRAPMATLASGISVFGDWTCTSFRLLESMEGRTYPACAVVFVHAKYSRCRCIIVDSTRRGKCECRVQPVPCSSFLSGRAPVNAAWGVQWCPTRSPRPSQFGVRWWIEHCFRPNPRIMLYSFRQIT